MNHKFFILDSQQLYLNETVQILRSRYPQAEIITAANTIDFLNQ